jgi:hypothetical protein
MDFTEVRAHVAQYTFPVDAETLASNLEREELEMHAARTETIDAVLERSGRSTFHSPEDVIHTLLGAVDDGYIPRKYYDDRAGARPSPHERPHQSF